MPVVVLSFVLRLSISEEDMIDEGSIMQMLADQRSNSIHNMLVNANLLSGENQATPPTRRVTEKQKVEKEEELERREYESVSDEDESEYHWVTRREGKKSEDTFGSKWNNWIY